MYPKESPAFSQLLRPLTTDEVESLENSILAHKEVFDPLIVWGETLIDGYHRLAVIKQHPYVKWAIRYLEFDNEQAAKAWCYEKQVGRRNLNPAAHGMAKATLLKLAANKSIQEAISESGASPSTVQRHRELDKILNEIPPEIRRQIEEGSRQGGLKSLQTYSELPEESKKDVISKLQSDRKLSVADALPKRNKLQSLSTLKPAFSSLPLTIQRLIATEKIPEPTTGDIARFTNLSAIQQTTIEDILVTNGEATLAEAIRSIALSVKPKPKPLPPSATDANEAVRKAFVALIQATDTLASTLKCTGSPDHQETLAIIRSANSRWKQWAKIFD